MVNGMNTTTILAAIGAIALILNTATRIPDALVELLHACRPVFAALRDLRDELHSTAIETDRDAC